jgi:hypothetical protein
MRWTLVALFATACGGSPKPAGPTLDPDPPPPPPKEMPSDFAKLFSPPSGPPAGDPIKVAPFAPKIGMKRVRTIDVTFTVDEELGEGKRFEQRSEKRFVLREEITQAASETVSGLLVAADTAEERIELNGKPHAQKLLDGSYTVAVKDQRLVAGRPAGADVGSRELEELDAIYSGELGQPDPIKTLLAKKTLRLGETIPLTDEDKQLLGVTGAFTMSLVALDGPVATFHFISTTIGRPYDLGSEGDKENVGLRLALAVDVTNGNWVRVDTLSLSVVEGKSRANRRSHRSVKFDYPR